jgi:hypothetical protein
MADVLRSTLLAPVRLARAIQRGWQSSQQEKADRIAAGVCTRCGENAASADSDQCFECWLDQQSP